jgi:deoxyadenosine kinase
MLFESGLMEKRDYQTYMSLFQNMSNFMKKPNIIVHLDVSPQESLRRIRERSRGCETGITLEYLTALHRGYEAFLNDISKIIPVIKVNYEQFPTVDAMAEAIADQYAKLSTIRYVFYDRPEGPVAAKEEAVVKAEKAEQAAAEAAAAPVAESA